MIIWLPHTPIPRSYKKKSIPEPAYIKRPPNFEDISMNRSPVSPTAGLPHYTSFNSHNFDTLTIFIAFANDREITYWLHTGRSFITPVGILTPKNGTQKWHKRSHQILKMASAWWWHPMKVNDSDPGRSLKYLFHHRYINPEFFESASMYFYQITMREFCP